MITSEALAKTVDTDPQFNVRILYLLSKATLPITVNELEYLYIETFRLDFSPLSHCNKRMQQDIWNIGRVYHKLLDSCTFNGGQVPAG